MPPIALTIAGSDPSGGAGIQADLKTFHQLDVFGAAAITLITVQNTTRLSRVELLDAGLVAEQIDAVLEDLPPAAAKTGALGNASIIEAISRRALRCPLVIDPVAIGKHGAPLLGSDAWQALTQLLIPKAALVTPNLDEAAVLSGLPVNNPDEMKTAALHIARLGCASILIKGGHLKGNALDLLLHEGRFTEFCSARVLTRHTHGTGCTYSAAITAFLARGFPMVDAVGQAKRFIEQAIRSNPGIGGGSGPVNHWASSGSL
ncbi:MAG: bifunctional hydroxymethylpyrimidine kinase/phosphomethylpyrimidine kinase [Acidobacteriota bacterium]|nr:bifunctional hydroxymethylpyrimidine kinase/phosphomethylpyrimidine kinase [Acidobacteriota bacterium]